MNFDDLPIKRKVMAVIMLTSVVALVLSAVTFIVYDVFSFRRLIVRNLATTAAIIADSSSAALAYEDEKTTTEALARLAADPRIVAAALYNDKGDIFARYPTNAPVASFPLVPGSYGAHLERYHIDFFQPVFEGNRGYGTLYLRSDLRALYERVRLYGGIALLILAGSVVVAFIISNALQRRITQPILALAEAARVVSHRKDYSVRARKAANDELGLLTDSFNEMLARIQEAAELRSFLAAIVDSSDDAIVGKDLQGTVLSWNGGAESMFGFTAAEMLGQCITRIIPPDRVEEEMRLIEAVKGEQIRHLETVRLHKSGRRVDISLSLSPIKDACGQVIGISSIARDISQRKRAESELHENRARLSGVIESAMDAIISVDSEQRITMFNAAAEKMFGCAVPQALGQPLDRFIPERFRQAHRQHVADFGRTGVTSRAMGYLRPLAGVRLNGEEFPIEASISQIDIAGQKIYTVILRDITERQRAQQALERHAAVLNEQAQLLELANVLARDLEDRIILWNTGMERMYGWTKAEALGQVPRNLLRTEWPQRLETIRAEVLAQGHWEGELVQFHKDGRRMVVASQWVLHRNQRGEPVAILEVNNDITERKNAEEQVLRLNTELELRVQERTAELTAANKELEAFTYSVAHDLRAPLRHIDAFSKLLHEDFAEVLPSDARHYLENIRRGSQNMSRLVDDLLNLARVGRQELKRQPTPLDGVVTEVVAELQRETGKRQIEWHIGSLPTIECDPGLVKQVFANLLSNAVKYTRPRSPAVIEVGCQAANGETALFVRDNGVGFNMKYADKLFGVFQRLHRAEEFEGTGVGLATVERIVRKHGGRIWAEGAVDHGAAFYFTLSRIGQRSPARVSSPVA